MMPPIMAAEYFYEPEVFKLRYALTCNNGKRVKKLHDMLESLLVMGTDIMPRWDKLNLKNVWYILAIMESWGPISTAMYGDYIFHPLL